MGAHIAATGDGEAGWFGKAAAAFIVYYFSDSCCNLLHRSVTGCVAFEGELQVSQASNRF